MERNTSSEIDLESLSQRLITEEDIPFLRDLYCTSRDYEVLNCGWPEHQLIPFLQQQFSLQHKYYFEVYGPEAFNVIEYFGEAVGRLYCEQSDKDIRLIDITLVRELRNSGIGSYLIRRLMQRADDILAKVSLHVLPENPALNLYLKLGFKQIGRNGSHLYMEYDPNNS